MLQTGLLGNMQDKGPLARNYCKNTDKHERKLGGEFSLERTKAKANILLYDQNLGRKPS